MRDLEAPLGVDEGGFSKHAQSTATGASSGGPSGTGLTGKTSGIGNQTDPSGGSRVPGQPDSRVQKPGSYETGSGHTG